MQNLSLSQVMNALTSVQEMMSRAETRLARLTTATKTVKVSADTFSIIPDSWADEAVIVLGRTPEEMEDLRAEVAAKRARVTALRAEAKRQREADEKEQAEREYLFAMLRDTASAASRLVDANKRALREVTGLTRAERSLELAFMEADDRIVAQLRHAVHQIQAATDEGRMALGVPTIEDAEAEPSREKTRRRERAARLAAQREEFEKRRQERAKKRAEKERKVSSDTSAIRRTAATLRAEAKRAEAEAEKAKNNVLAESWQAEAKAKQAEAQRLDRYLSEAAQVDAALRATAAPPSAPKGAALRALRFQAEVRASLTGTCPCGKSARLRGAALAAHLAAPCATKAAKAEYARRRS